MSKEQRAWLMSRLHIEITKALVDGDFDGWFTLRAQRNGWHRLFRATKAGVGLEVDENYDATANGVQANLFSEIDRWPSTL